jgi:uncharacterized membrane protein
MNTKTYNLLRVLIAIFVLAIVILGFAGGDLLLVLAGLAAGALFLAFVRSPAGREADEREVSVREKAAHLTYAIFAPTIGIGGLLLLVPSHSGLAVFANGDFAFLDALGMVFAYLTLFLISVYAISHHFIDRGYGGGVHEE